MSDVADRALDPAAPPMHARRSFAALHAGILLPGAVLFLFAFIAVFGTLMSPYDPYYQDLAHRVVPPVWMEGGGRLHLLGTDALGRDYLSRIITGTSVSMQVGLFAVSISAAIGISLGLLAGYVGGAVDKAVLFLVNVRLSLPIMMIALAVVALHGGSLTTLIVLLGCLLWDRFAVVTRSAAMKETAKDYVSAARTFGCSAPYVMLREILPNIVGPLLVVATLEVAHAILMEAALSFLGLGVPPPIPTWGLMMSEGRDLIFFEGWLITLPGLALFALVLAINLFGDGLRDLLAKEP